MYHVGSNFLSFLVEKARFEQWQQRSNCSTGLSVDSGSASSFFLLECCGDLRGVSEPLLRPSAIKVFIWRIAFYFDRYSRSSLFCRGKCWIDC